ncbi:magnesium transporter NIPA-domain-containing protein [Mycena metata]|uniref:Magnesium transporter NIPA-domain-containing protein n=1 Tax=Mycena metata TaxID=1033252 RepID=A0AAD7JDE1_9AGAR|nr:magnesium transporter NIPA-domain-containing protein [Mycena metata]
MPSLTVRAAASASTTAKAAFHAGSNLKIVGIVLAITSGLLIGSSFVFKKKGLLRAQAGHTAGEGVAYLKSPLWWTGMTMMILGELCNFAAYAFVEAIVVTPLGALSVVVCAILSSIFLKETLTFFGWLGCVLSILGSVIIALNGPSEASVGQIEDFQKLFLSVGFLVYAGLLITAALVIIFFAAPRWGKKSMLWYIFVCSMIGGISVSVTTGLGAAIVTTAAGDNQFTHWFIYFLFGFVAITLITEVYYLNVALALFNTGMVTPTYYVIFTFFSILTTIVLFKGLSAPVSSILTLIMGFLVICVGIIILQMSKVDPTEFKQLDRRSTILLQAARSHTETFEEKSAIGVEDPGIDALRGSFGTVGSIIRARSARRMSQASMQGRPPGAGAPFDRAGRNSTNPRLNNTGLQRHQLYDAPMPGIDLEARSQRSDSNATSPGPGIAKRTTIKFDAQDVVHQYHPTGGGGGTPRRDEAAIHAFRPALPSPGLPSSASLPGEEGYPPRTRADTEPMGGNAKSGSRDLLLSELDEPAPPSNLRSPLSTQGAGQLSASTRQQTLSLPDAFSNEHAVHSAPPTLMPRFPAPKRMDSRDIFSADGSDQKTPTGQQVRGSPQSGTLLSFPSVTDSARSANWEDGAPAGSGSSSTPGTPGRGRGQKKYPKTAGEDDREESVSLWQRGEGGRESEDAGPMSSTESESSAEGMGIRLVQPRF